MNRPSDLDRASPVGRALPSWGVVSHFAIALALGACRAPDAPRDPVLAPSASGTASALGAQAVSSADPCEPMEQPYAPHAAYSGPLHPKLPVVPPASSLPKKNGDAYTVFGASHDLASLAHADDFADKKIDIIGYVVATNYASLCAHDLHPASGERCVPRCAVHKTGKGDPDGCMAPVPTFWIADTKDADPRAAIRVMGWASNFAQLYDLMTTIAAEPDDAKKDAVERTDVFYGVPNPVPVPAMGAQVRVTGAYGFSYRRSTSGVAVDPVMGILTYDKLATLAKAPVRVMLPGMTKK